MTKLTSGFRFVSVAGLSVIDASHDLVIDRLLAGLARGERYKIAFFNSRLLVTLCNGKAGTQQLSDFAILNDGLAASAAAAISSGRFFQNNLNGTDFTPEFLRRLPAGSRVFLYGGGDGVSAQAAKTISKMSSVDIVGCLDGFSVSGAAAADRILESQPDVVLVALGNPLQEIWIAEHGDRTGAQIIMGVGALFDFLSERIDRAPRWVRALRLEWAYRLMLEPRRMLRRYTVDTLKFFWIVWRERRKPEAIGDIRLGSSG